MTTHQAEAAHNAQSLSRQLALISLPARAVVSDAAA
jgi:hypothetical protein